MDKIQFPYRSDGHLVFLHVVHESGSWEKHGLDVNYDYWISADESHKAVGKGEVEFVSGNHVTPYAARLKGDPWAYLGQTVNLYNHRLVVRPQAGINGIADLKGKTIGHRGEHPGLNNWLFLKEAGLDVDRGDIRMEKWKGDDATWQGILAGQLDAALVTPPDDLLAKRAGLKVIDVPFQPMIWFTTISSSSPFAAKHGPIVE
ncbi:MAG: ABC transporter substrate-binding protein, partial [Candidatus Binatia bacterium]